MIHLLAEDVGDEDIQKMRDYLGIEAEFEFLEGNYADAQVGLVNPCAVTGVPDCVSKIIDTDVAALFFNYSVSVNVHSTRATRDEPGEYDWEVNEEDISFDNKAHGNLFTPEEVAEIDAFFTMDKCTEIDDSVFERLRENAAEDYSEDDGGDDRDDYYEDR